MGRWLFILLILGFFTFVFFKSNTLELTYTKTMDEGDGEDGRTDKKNYQEVAIYNLLKRWREKNYGFPYLIDSTQTVAQAFDAVCTPDLFLYDADRRLYYHGRIQQF